MISACRSTEAAACAGTHAGQGSASPVGICSPGSSLTLTRSIAVWTDALHMDLSQPTFEAVPPAECEAAMGWPLQLTEIGRPQGDTPT